MFFSFIKFLIKNVAIKKRLLFLQNATESEKISKLPKRHASASAAASATTITSDLLGGNLWDAVPLTELDAHSCEIESIEYGHVHLSGTVVHELGCEIRKFWHYILIAFRNIKEAFTLGPLIAGEVIVEGSHGILGRLLHYVTHVFRHIIKEPHHLVVLPDIICDSVPFPSIFGAIHRLKSGFFKLLRFVRQLIREHVRLVFKHFFRFVGAKLREKLHFHLEKSCLGGLYSVLPFANQFAEPVESVVTTTATATATATTNDMIPDYHRSLAEVLTSLRGFYNGYVASGVPHLIRTGVGSVSTSSAVTTVKSYLSALPFSSYFGCGQDAAVASTATSTVSTSSVSAVSVATPAIAPIVSPTIVPTAYPVVEPIVESATASAAASATAVVTETEPIIVPVVAPTVPCEATSIISDSSAATATATAAATATATAASPVEIVPLIQPVPTLSPVVVPDIVEETVSASSSATASAASSVSSTSDVVPSSLPIRLPLFRPALSAPVASASAASSAASSSMGSPVSLIPNQYRNRYRLRQPVLSSGVVPSAAAASAAVSAATSLEGASATNAASSFIDGFNFALPRQDVISALGYDYLLPGDVVAITLRNRSVLCGRVLDGTSPISFGFLKPKLRAKIFRNGRRIWNLLPRHFRNPECVRRLNNPLLLRYSQRWL